MIMNDEMKEKIYTFDRDDMDSDDLTIEDLAQMLIDILRQHRHDTSPTDWRPSSMSCTC
jgi:hypothetical protein